MGGKRLLRELLVALRGQAYKAAEALKRSVPRAEAIFAGEPAFYRSVMNSANAFP
jgi:hypothetical protein